MVERRADVERAGMGGVMLGIANSYSFLFQHPIIGLLVLAVVGAGVILVLSGGKLGETLGAMFRVFITFFTTPFVFLRDALGVMRDASDNEQDYQQSRVFMLFRLNKLQYLGLVVVCVLVLASGITSSVVSLWPSMEIERGRQLSEQITELEAQLATAQEAAAAAGAPDYRQQLETQRTETRTAYQQQLRSNAEFAQSTTYSGGVITQIQQARSASSVTQARDNMAYYMQGCPRAYNWRGMTQEDCTNFQAFALELANRRLSEFEMQRVANEAEEAFRQADSAAQMAQNQVENVQGQIEYATAQRNAISLWNPDVLGSKLVAALTNILTTLFSVIILVWVGATAISFFSWLILMMRTLERLATDKLAQLRPSEDLYEPKN